MEEKKDNLNNGNENSTCPPIKIDMHQNSYQPKNVETRGSNENE